MTSRRRYIEAITVILGLSGCSGRKSSLKKHEEAMDTFTDITEFEAPMENIASAARFVDEEAGLVFYGFHHQFSGTGAGSEFQIVTKSLNETNLRD